MYLYGTKTERENTALECLHNAQNHRKTVEQKWNTYLNYWGFKHKRAEIDKDDEDSSAYDVCVPDAFIQIESQINPEVPEPVFKGVDDKSDSQKALQRQYVVRNILNKNDVDSQNTMLERTMRIYSDAFAKVYWDANAQFDAGAMLGDIKVDVVNLFDVYPDPTATSLDNCEFIDYCYKRPSRAIWREYGKELKKAGFDEGDIEKFKNGDYQSVLTRGEKPEDGEQLPDGMVEVFEHWFKDDDGDIACCILIDGKEIRFIKKYWLNTGAQNKRFPFVHFWRIKSPNSFWNISELMPLIPQIDVADKMLQDALVNMDYSSNDIIIAEQGALIDTIPENNPGAIWTVKDGMGQTIRRLGGVNKLASYITDVQYFRSVIQQTARNYDTNTGGDTNNQKTASGLSQIRADAQSQAQIKDKDRNNAWKRLFQLIDWTALEFYDEPRMVFIGVPDAKPDNERVENLDAHLGNIHFKYNSNEMREKRTKITEVSQDEAGLPVNITEDEYYYPSVDVEIKATTGLVKSKSFTISSLEAILQMQISESNYKIVCAIINELDIPQSHEIVNDITAKFKASATGSQTFDDSFSQLAPDAQAAINANPNLKERLIARAKQGEPQKPEEKQTAAQPRFVNKVAAMQPRVANSQK